MYNYITIGGDCDKKEIRTHKPYITVLIPLFNGVDFLNECITSVIQQTYQKWEVVIGINGHGNDGGLVATKTYEIAKRDTRIRVIVQPPPLSGKVESLNDLMNYVEGEWVCLLDCDDLWHPTKLEEQVNAKDTVARNAAVIGTFCHYFGELDGIPSLPPGWIPTVAFSEFNPIINSSAMIHRSYCYWRYTDVCKGVMEDYDLWMRISLMGGKLYNVPKVLCSHRIHKASAFNTKEQNPKPLQDEYRLAQLMYFGKSH
jgi:glycosyltransferase involved in cell wall biosynthesis